MNMRLINSYKGLHPGIFLKLEFKKRKIVMGPFAISINEYPQTLGAIINGKKRMNLRLSRKLERALNLHKGTLMLLQIYHDLDKVS